MISSLKHTFIITTVFFLNIELCVCACALVEYELKGECCPMCPPGHRVFRNCTKFTSTICILCADLTYMDEPNGLPSCISCMECDTGQGLRVKTACTQTSDTVCEPLDGFYCSDGDRGSCIYAEEHKKCSPGTAIKDTVCALCADGTYSDGFFQICKQHTKCEDLGLTEIAQGTHTFDAVCRRRIPAVLIADIITYVVPICLTAFGLAVLCVRNTWILNLRRGAGQLAV
ncbi:tumor necrosis factor receptor superfamily member 14-like isoform X2 [Tachysurus fulvidraco]|uniref:tumor necrosis factor receptor superfamily member 14-like isoform X2 n=1 Tax=Tachysurus fulvidraco TaxID=1234273 RepID=UPI000F4DFE7C|nr:tumor necrosis factor receptor superfamily member 14-like isoform X2 [Tachysurus fulvidraco]